MHALNCCTVLLCLASHLVVGSGLGIAIVLAPHSMSTLYGIAAES